jgi:hypothetical protein
VFERKWQSLPRFQKTRGILRLLALWVSHAYKRGYEGAHRDPLIGLGTAPLDDPYFRAALFEQLGNNDLEGPVTTDIAGKKEAHALRLDREADEVLKSARLHRKIATVILFESNGGTTRAEATVPEIRLAVAEPDLDIASVENALEALTDGCYYLSVDRNRYRFSLNPNLNKILTDRRAGVTSGDIDERVKQVVQDAFKIRPPGLDLVLFPERSGQVADRPVLTLVVMAPGQAHGDPSTRRLIEQVVKEYGQSGRTFKSALLFAVAESDALLRDEARKLLAWEDVREDDETIKRLDEGQRRQLDTGVKKAARDLKEAVWRSYKNLILLGRDNNLQDFDLGLVNSSAAGSLAGLYVNRLRERDEITESVGPSRLIKAWSPAHTEWTTRAVRDAFYASPALPRLLNANAVRRTIADGVNQKLIAYRGKVEGGAYDPFIFEPDSGITESDIEISDDFVILKAVDARKPKEPPRLSRIEIRPAIVSLKPGESASFSIAGFDQHGHGIACTGAAWAASGGEIDSQGRFTAGVVGTYQVSARVEALEAFAQVRATSEPPPPPEKKKGFRWRGTVPPQKWMNFYTKVLSGLTTPPGVTIQVSFDVPPTDAPVEAKIEATKTALRELGLSEDVEPTS